MELKQIESPLEFNIDDIINIDGIKHLVVNHIESNDAAYYQYLCETLNTKH